MYSVDLAQMSAFALGTLITGLFYFTLHFVLPLKILHVFEIHRKKRMTEIILTISFLASFYSFVFWYFLKYIYLNHYQVPMTIALLISYMFNATSFKGLYRHIAYWKCWVIFAGVFIANFVIYCVIVPCVMPTMAQMANMLKMP